MDEYDDAYESGDSEMLDEVSDNVNPATISSPLHAFEDTSSEQARDIEPERHSASDNICTRSFHICEVDGHPAASHASLQDQPVPVNQPSTSKDGVESSSSIVARIEGLFETMVDVLLNERGQPCIAIKSRPTSKRQQLAPSTTAEMNDDPVQHLCFPGKTEKEAWQFAVVTRILELIHEALRNDVVLSKRDIYYRDPALFGRQSHVDRYVDKIAYTFGVTRSALHVIAAAKGLIAGAVRFCRRDGSTVDASSDREGLLMSNVKDILSADLSATKWILVVEKEATFRSIAASDFWPTLSTNGIMVTAKGYPDISTRAMLRLLTSPSPQNGFSSPPVYGMMDFDPDGIAIFLTYKYGSRNLSHETSHLCLPQLRWLGLRSEHVLGGNTTHAEQGLLLLSARDRSKARKMLEWQVVEDENVTKRELQVMLMLGHKGELQLLDAMPHGMGALLGNGLST